MVIHDPRNFRIRAKGQIVLTYKGENQDAFGCVACRDADWNITLMGAANSVKELIFQVDFHEFYRMPLHLDFTERLVRGHGAGAENLSEIGAVRIERISCDEDFLVVTGSYRHESISLAYHQNDLVNFHACLDMRPLAGRFNQKMFRESLSQYDHLGGVAHYLD